MSAQRLQRSAIAPRLLTKEEAATYLSLPVATVVRLGIGRVRLGIHTRYDVAALDEHLDAMRGAVANAAPSDEAEAALARFTQGFGRASGNA